MNSSAGYSKSLKELLPAANKNAANRITPDCGVELIAANVS